MTDVAMITPAASLPSRSEKSRNIGEACAEMPYVASNIVKGRDRDLIAPV